MDELQILCLNQSWLRICEDYWDYEQFRKGEYHVLEL
jgi:hypothetical protein